MGGGSQELRIRSTCNACQEAKVRCSRDKPNCRRCQNQSRRCVYSYCQRLGRPRRTTDSRIAGKSVQDVQDDDNMSDDFASSGSPAIQPSGLVEQDEHHHTTPTETSYRDPESEIRYPIDLGLSFGNDNDTTFDNFQFHQLFHESPTPTWSSHQPFSPVALGITTKEFNGLLSPLDISSDSEFNFLNPTDSHFASSHRLEDRTPQASGSKRSYSENDFHKVALISSSLQEFETSLVRPVSSSSSYRGDGAGRACKCYHSILRRLSDLHQKQTSNINTTIDEVMKVEKDVRTQILEVLECRRCANNGSLLLLLSVLLENVIELLEGIGFGGVDTFGNGQDGSVLSNGSSTAMDFTALKLGSYEIDGEEKADFLKRLFNQRLQRLAATIKMLHDCIQKNTGRSGVVFNRKIGTTVTTEIYQRLSVIIHRLDH